MTDWEFEPIEESAYLLDRDGDDLLIEVQGTCRKRYRIDPIGEEVVGSLPGRVVLRISPEGETTEVERVCEEEVEVIGLRERRRLCHYDCFEVDEDHFAEVLGTEQGSEVVLTEELWYGPGYRTSIRLAHLSYPGLSPEEAKTAFLLAVQEGLIDRVKAEMWAEYEQALMAAQKDDDFF